MYFFFIVSSITLLCCLFFFFSSRRRHTRFDCDWSSDVCSSDLFPTAQPLLEVEKQAVVDALRRAKGNKTQAAAALGLSRGAFYRRLERFGLVDRKSVV